MSHHRYTFWHDDRGDCWQISAACLDEYLEAHAEVTLACGPFDDPLEVLAQAQGSAESLGGWRAHQTTLRLHDAPSGGLG
jgi:hypothetical protein